MKNLLFLLCFLPVFLFAQVEQPHNHDHPHKHTAVKANPKSSQPSLTIQPIEGPTPWTNLDLNNDSTHFQFAIISDRTGGHREGVYMDAVNKLNLLQPEFVVTVGDLIEGYTTDLDELTRQWDEFDGFVNKLQMPFFYLPGNHDMSNDVMEHLWAKRLGPSYYHFVYKNILFLMLNSEEDTGDGYAKGNFTKKQYQYVQKTLSENETVDWTLVFFHQPVWNHKKASHWEAVEKLLKKRKHTVFTGHEHRYVKYRRNDSNYYILATTGGASGLRGPSLGEFDHVMWVTMTPKGPILANLLLDGIWDENIFTEDDRTFVERLQQNPPIQITPFFIEDQNFKEGEVILRITNDEDVPMTVKLGEEFSDEVIGILDKRNLTVGPNSVEKVKLIIQRRSKTFDHPMKVNAKVTYQMESSKIELPYSFNIKPLQKYTLRKRKGRRKKIDGKSKDWKNMPFHYEAQDGGDMQVDFDICYDDQYVYFAAKILDDTIMTFGKGAVWSQDNIGFGISALPLAKSAMSTGTNWYTNELYQLISPSTDKIKSQTYKPMPEGSEIKCVVTKTGYFMEAKMPISYLEERQGKNWKTLRLIVVVDDKDEGIHRYWWKPTWMNPKTNIVGSGMFFRK